ncbi:hypothetical protein KXD40_006631 [Peronospora effusa]|uniref:Uncharacterized protein n=1 Tax=Peronospora effusa TaxID=542832 RepID=A0A3M6VDP0_9STRA|nr:hypothetical protein DD238_004186 [Peronospora effusa]RQM17588.1 hypothetical protein DD237_003118 [Peronospora effusa]UIZ24969.1 hypothetical protein KXD40_006631 [Peronospora effusa]
MMLKLHVAFQISPFFTVKKGKRKKRTGVSSEQRLPVATKSQRAHENGCSQPLQQDDGKTRLIFDVNQFASVLSIDSRICNSLITQCAAQNGFVLASCSLLSRLVFYKIERTYRPLELSSKPRGSSQKGGNIAFIYTLRHAKEIYDTPVARNHQLSST